MRALFLITALFSQLVLGSTNKTPIACYLYDASGNALSSTAGALNISGGIGGGGNAAASLTGLVVPTSAGYTGFSSGGNLVGVSTSNPLPVAQQGSVAVTGTFWQATQPVSGTVAATQSGTWTVQPGNTANTTAWKVDGSAVTQPVSGTVTANQGGTWTVQPGNTANTTAWKVDGSAVTQPVSGTVGITNAAAVAKGTQGANGVPTQALLDSGRSARTISLDGFAVAATTETLNTMSYSTDNGALTTGTSYTVTAGKRLRVQQITASIHTVAGNTTAVTCIVRIRANNAGAAIVSSPVQYVMALPSTAAANASAGPVVSQFPDGWEFVAAAGIGVTTTCPGFVATTAAPKINISITGFEY